MNGEIIIYDEDNNHNYKRIKIGNGIDNVNDLDFVVNKEDIPEGVTSWDDLEDRPFYEIISGDVLLEEQTITTSEDNGNGRYFTNYTIPSPLQLTAEEKYIVVWDGIPYETVYTGKLGNLNAYHPQAPDSGEPFFIELNDLNLEICCPKEGEHTFAIYASNYSSEVKKLNSKFIPNISWNNLSDKPFYESISGDVLLEERTVNLQNPVGDNTYCIDINASLAVTQGNEYTIVWDGIPYKVTAGNNTLGNIYLVGGPDSGEPFFMGVGDSSLHIRGSQGEHTFAIYSSNYNCEVKQLDEKFIPNISIDKLPNISWNNLTNKPFYEIISGDILLEEQDINLNNKSGNGYETSISIVLTVTQGKEYTVIWDGIPYKVIATTNTLGNMYWTGPSNNTGEPFFIGFDTSEIDIFAETQGKHTLAIYSNYNCEVKQLDEKYIPDTNWNNLLDRPFYENISGDILLEEQTVNCSESTGNGYSVYINASLAVTEGNEYTVIWDGIPYKVIAETNSLGNMYWNGSSTNTGEPFFIGASGSRLYIATENQEEHTLEVYSNYSYEVKQLEEKFIPNINWEKISNKPFYESISGDVLLEEQAITISEDNGNGRYFTDLDLTSLVDLKLEEKYIVVWDDIPYETVYTGKLGNVNAYHSQAPDTGEPFFISGGGLHLEICCPEEGEHTFAIYASNYNYELKQLDEKFIPNISTDKLPDISWNKISDKPFYESITGDILLEEQPVNLSSSNSNGYYTYINTSLAVTQGNEYTVIWDCVPYKVTVKTTSGGSRYLGNLYWGGSAPNTGEPFFIAFNNDGTLYVAAETQGEHTLAIYSDYNYELKQLDEKFIPNISWNNLTDKPFYENISGDILLEEQPVNLSSSSAYSNGYYTYINASLAVTQGNEYTVIWDGVLYTLTAGNNTLGNKYLYLGGSNPNTGEPFFINIDNSYIFAETQGEHTLAIYSNYNYEFKQLDEKFIPDISIDKLPDISWNDLTDKPFYESITGDILLEEQPVNLSSSNSNGYYTYINTSLAVTQGNEYTVIWDGVLYTLTAGNNTLGNKYLYWGGSNPNTGEPFYIAFNNDGTLFVVGETQGEHTLAIYSNYNYELKQLEEKFIPNVNWEKISNKPFYENISGDVLLEEQVINFTSDRIFKELSFIDNTIYTVIWDGVKYECLKEEGKSYIGNFSIVVPSSPDTGEPFFIDTPSIYCKTQGEHVVAIYSDYNCEVKKLDEKFIPDISWNNLKDKPFYENISGDVLLEKQIVNCSESTANGYSTNINASLTVIEGNEYTVIWDGVPYTLTAVGTTLGNIYWNGSSTNTGEPFFIGVSSFSVNTLYIATENQEEHTLEVYSNYNYEVKQLDEKYIPDNIRGVGKSTTGTVYTINNTEVTAKEGAEIFNSYSNNIASGLYSHAEGYYGKASGDYSHAEGHSTKAEGYISHAEGFATYATGSWSHAEGHSSVASGITSHAEGGSSTASGHTSHAEGNGTTASGDFSHAEGNGATASGDYSHAEGKNTIASGSYQHVQGKYNIEDTENKYAHIVGNGEGLGLKKRSNAHTLDWDGNAWYQGNVYVGGTSQYDSLAKKLASEEYVNNAANQVKNDLLNGAGEAYDTLKELGDLINENVDTIEALETVASGKADKEHTHSWNEITDKPFNDDEFNIITKDNVIDALVELDMLYAVTDSDNAILADENGNILSI